MCSMSLRMDVYKRKSDNWNYISYYINSATEVVTKPKDRNVFLKLFINGLFIQRNTYII